MAETDLHRQDMIDTIQTLEDHYDANPDVYVSGNLLLFYERGNRRKHVSPDTFVVFGVPKQPLRDYYLLWEEGRPPDVVIEITSKTTRRDDQQKKRVIYRDILKVPEYFQFDPTRDYLKPPLQGFRLVNGDYLPIDSIAGRLPSERLGLHLEQAGAQLRLFDPATKRWLLTRRERVEQEALARIRAEAEHDRAEAQRERAEAERERAEAERGRAEVERERAEAQRDRAESETERLRSEIEALKRQLRERE
jgi:Uma2 family endonuclease